MATKYTTPFHCPTDTFSGVLFHRDTVNNARVSSSPTMALHPFTVVSYNILADCHLIPLPDDASDDDKLAYDRGNRHERLMEEVRFLDGDIVCMQEVGPRYYEEHLLEDMKSLGYEGSYKKRIGDYYKVDDGVATFVSASRFDWLSSESVVLRESCEKDINESGLDEATKMAVREYIFKPDVVLIERLKCRETGESLVVGNVHVTWSEMKVPDIQALQIACAFRELLSRADGGQTAHVLCGDFNQLISLPGYQLACDGVLSKDKMAELESLAGVNLANGEKVSLVSLLSKSFQHSSESVKSVYLEVQGVEPLTTTQISESLDYIFYCAHSLRSLGVLTVAQLAEKGTTNVPSVLYHSDHLSLKASFDFCTV